MVAWPASLGPVGSKALSGLGFLLTLFSSFSSLDLEIHLAGRPAEKHGSDRRVGDGVGAGAEPVPSHGRGTWSVFQKQIASVPGRMQLRTYMNLYSEPNDHTQPQLLN